MNMEQHHGPKAGEPVLDVRGLCIGFGRHLRRQALVVRDVDLAIAAGETLGLVGESGSGKTTTTRAILGLLRAQAGSIRCGGHDVTAYGTRIPSTYRRDVQAVFQDPLASLNPSTTVGDSVAEPLRLDDSLGPEGRRARVVEVFEAVGLRADQVERYPYELSGGQRQRVSIARALSVRPKLIVLDEPVSALDVAVQSQVINLLEDLQRESGVAYLLVGHDLAVVRHTSHRIAVMLGGRVVEHGPTDRVCDEPAHPYTQQLLDAAVEPDPTLQAEKRRRRRDDAPVERAVPTIEGCPFYDRCRLRSDVCRTTRPPWHSVPGGGAAACHALGRPADSHRSAAAPTPNPTVIPIHS